MFHNIKVNCLLIVLIISKKMKITKTETTKTIKSRFGALASNHNKTPTIEIEVSIKYADLNQKEVLWLVDVLTFNGMFNISDDGEALIIEIRATFELFKIIFDNLEKYLDDLKIEDTLIYVKVNSSITMKSLDRKTKNLIKNVSSVKGYTNRHKDVCSIFLYEEWIIVNDDNRDVVVEILESDDDQFFYL